MSRAVDDQVQGELRQHPPSGVGGGCCRARPIPRSRTFAQLAAYSCSDVFCRCFVDVYYGFPSMMRATTSKAASIVPVMPAEACISATVLSEHTLDNRFQVDRQSIGSYFDRRAIVACDRYRLTLFLVYCGRQWVSNGIFTDLRFGQFAFRIYPS